MSWDPQFWAEALQRVLTDLMAWLPTLAATLLMLLVGWGVARLVQAFLAGTLLRLGVDRLAERTGAARMLQDLGMAPSIVRPLSRLAFWLVLLVFLLAALESLGTRQVTQTLGGVVAYLPRILAAIFILLLGGLVARLVGNALGAMAGQAGVRGGLAAGAAVRSILLAFVVILALEELGLETTLLVAIATVLVAATALAMAVSFGWGSRGLARSIMAGFHARDEFTVGQRLMVRGHTGRLVSIGPVKSVLETETGAVSLPNYVLVEEEVLTLPENEPPG